MNEEEPLKESLIQPKS